MSTTIYYFTGTGNSLKIARDIAETLSNTELVPITRATEEQLSQEKDTIGIVFPVYAWGPPLAVIRFLDKINISPGSYVFTVCTCGGSAGGTLKIVKKKLSTRGVTVSSGFIIPMPSNYIVWGEALTDEKQQEMFANAKARIAEICGIISNKKLQEVEMGGLFSRALSSLVYKTFKGAAAKGDKKYDVDENCNSCGICEKVCPVDNIEMQDGKPVWLHHCEVCLACIQWCPQEAIQVGSKTRGRRRYHHPEIQIKDLMQ